MTIQDEQGNSLKNKDEYLLLLEEEKQLEKQDQIDFEEMFFHLTEASKCLKKVFYDSKIYSDMTSLELMFDNFNIISRRLLEHEEDVLQAHKKRIKEFDEIISKIHHETKSEECLSW